jgi:hypothetical protein
MVTFLWIAFDVAISVRMMTTGYPLWEIALWFFGGIALAVGAWVIESREKKASDKQMLALEGTVGILRQELSEARSYQSGKLDMLGLLGGETFHQLQNLTQTTGQPAVRVIEIANTTIETLQGEISDLRSMFWRRLTDDEEATLREKIAAIGKYSFRVISAHPADCHELTGDLTRVLESAGWERKLAPTYVEEHELDDWDLLHTSGIRILGKYPADNEPGSKLLEALRSVIKGGLMFGASRSGDVADVVLVIGPKGARTVQS